MGSALRAGREACSEAAALVPWAIAALSVEALGRAASISVAKPGGAERSERASSRDMKSPPSLTVGSGVWARPATRYSSAFVTSSTVCAETRIESPTLMPSSCARTAPMTTDLGASGPSQEPEARAPETLKTFGSDAGSTPSASTGMSSL